MTVCLCKEVTSFIPSLMQPFLFGSVPCGPDNLLVDLDCASGGMNISWSAQKNSEGYLAVISYSNSQMSYYNTTEPKLIVQAKECGQEYTVQVKSFNKSCVSFPSAKKVSDGKTCLLLHF